MLWNNFIFNDFIVDFVVDMVLIDLSLTHSLPGKYETLTSPCANAKYQVYRIIWNMKEI